MLIERVREDGTVELQQPQGGAATSYYVMSDIAQDLGENASIVFQQVKRKREKIFKKKKKKRKGRDRNEGRE